ncbi:MAG: acyltransferase [Porphyrobacter sp.]|nr:acyltransferase [Porphyrobacter sp.]
MDANPASPRERLPLLDGMRGIAALAVLFYHAPHLGLMQPLVPRGYLFVDFFFLLSGFVLGLSAEPRLQAGLTAEQFMKRRIRRLWPILAIGSLVGLVPHAMIGDLPQALWFLPLGLLMIPALWSSGLVFPLNGPYWSLSFELLANALHALVLARLRDVALLTVVVASGLWLGWAIAGYGANELGMDSRNWIGGIPRVVFSYALGVLLARSYRGGGLIARLRWNWALAVFVPLAVVLTLPHWPLPRAAGDILTTLLLLPLCFALMIGARLPEPLVPLFAGLGLLSYPLYAVHLPILGLAAMLPPVFLGGLTGPMAALLLAAVLARRMETPKPRETLPDRPEKPEIAAVQEA